MSQHAQLEAPPSADEEDRRQILEKLFSQYFGSVQAYFLRQGLPAEEARDLAQETFFRAWKGVEGFRSDARASTWLFKIARNLLLNVWRDRRAQKRDGLTLPFEIEDDEGESFTAIEVEADEDPEEDALEVERNTLLRESLEKLPKQMQQCLRLRLEDLKYREIAEILGVSIETVKSHLHQARQRLKADLGHYFEDDLELGAPEDR